MNPSCQIDISFIITKEIINQILQIKNDINQFK
jgi:hypothetical protein